MLGQILSGAYRVITDIAKVIDARKKLKGTKVAAQDAALLIYAAPSGEHVSSRCGGEDEFVWTVRGIKCYVNRC